MPALRHLKGLVRLPMTRAWTWRPLGELSSRSAPKQRPSAARLIALTKITFHRDYTWILSSSGSNLTCANGRQVHMAIPLL